MGASADILYQFEDTLETAVLRYLKTVLVPPLLSPDQIIPHQSVLEIKTPCVQVHISHEGSDDTSYRAFSIGGVEFALPVMFKGTMRLTIMTQRGPGEINHKALIGKCRFLALDFGRKLNTDALLPYHTIDQVRDGGANYSLDADRKIDITEMSFPMVYSIRSEAWEATV